MFNSNSKGIWSAKYPKHGRMLNCHDSGAQNLRKPGVHEKSVDTRKRLGSYKYSPQLHTPESVAKAVTTRKANGVYAKLDTSLLHTPEAVAKAVTTRKANGVYAKQAKRISIKNKSPEMIALQQSGRRQKATKYRLTGDYDFVGTITDCAKVLHCNTPVLKQFIGSNKMFKGCKIERL